MGRCLSLTAWRGVWARAVFFLLLLALRGLPDLQPRLPT